MEPGEEACPPDSTTDTVPFSNTESVEELLEKDRLLAKVGLLCIYLFYLIFVFLIKFYLVANKTPFQNSFCLEGSSKYRISEFEEVSVLG